METITLTKKQLEKLTPYKIPKEVTNTESEIYILDKGNWRYNDGSLLLKKLHVNSSINMANKLFTVSLLSDNEDIINMEELVVPKHLVSVENKAIGFTVPRIIQSTNLGMILNNPKVENEKKIAYLHRIGKLLEKTKKLEISGINFHFGDLHEFNFVVSDCDDKIHAIDLDSAYLNTGYPSPSYYLATNKNIGQFKRKYRINREGINLPDYNSDLFCYNMMILNMIGRDKISKLNMSDYFQYISYLNELGFGKHIIGSFADVYSSGKNVNPVNYFDEIPTDKLGEAGYKVYSLKKSRGII